MVSTARFRATNTRAQEQDGSLQHGDVALEDGAVEQEAGSGPGEHCLHQDRAAHQVAELQRQ